MSFRGFIFWTTLFSIFTSPVSHLISSFNVLCYHYADDTQLYTSISLSSDQDINNFSDCADADTRWRLKNNLLLNPLKTEALITGARKQVTKFESSTPAIRTIPFADTAIPRLKSVHILGVTIDSPLTFDKHITSVVQSCNYHIHSKNMEQSTHDSQDSNITPPILPLASRTLTCLAMHLDDCRSYSAPLYLRHNSR